MTRITRWELFDVEVSAILSLPAFVVFVWMASGSELWAFAASILALVSLMGSEWCVFAALDGARRAVWAVSDWSWQPRAAPRACGWQ